MFWKVLPFATCDNRANNVSDKGEVYLFMPFHTYPYSFN